MNRVILASASQTRLKMLRDAGLEVEAVPSGLNEDQIKIFCRANHRTADETAEALALGKAEQLTEDYPNDFIIGADQMLECDGRWFDKPADREDAIWQLRMLRGRPHRLISAAVMMDYGGVLWQHTDEAILTMRDFSDDFLTNYLDGAGEAVLASVGGYQLEGLGAQLFEKVEGDYFTILGLPLLPLLDALRRQGALRK